MTVYVINDKFHLLFVTASGETNTLWLACPFYSFFQNRQAAIILIYKMVTKHNRKNLPKYNVEQASDVYKTPQYNQQYTVILSFHQDTDKKITIQIDFLF